MKLVPRTVARAARALVAPWRTKAAPASLSGVDGWGAGWLRFLEWKPGSFQQDIEVRQDRVVAQATVFACITLIAGDIGKLRLKFVEKTDGVCVESSNTAYSPVLAKPNHYQTRQQFVEQWIVSKLTHGNTYALKERDARGVVKRLYVLDPTRVRPLIAPDGSVYYALQQDDLNQVPEFAEAIPASEIIHDRMTCLFHPLVGVTPIFANGLAAMQALAIQQNSAKFFENMSRPGGIITGPNKIGDETAKRIKEHWERGFTGDKIGRVAVLGDSLAYTPLSVNPDDAQLVEQLKLSAEQVCSTFHVPGYKVGVGATPTYQNAEVLNQIYFTDCLQKLIKAFQDTLKEGLALGPEYSIHFDLDELLLMDSKTKAEVQGTLTQRGIAKINEARAKFNLPPVDGGDTPYLQQQNYSLEALAKRDAGDDPFGSATPTPAPAPAPADDGSKALGVLLASMQRASEDAQRAIKAAADALAAVQQREPAEIDQTDAALAKLFRKAPEELTHA